MKLLATAILAILSTASLASAEPQRPSIIFVLADDIGYGDLGCYGATAVKTPNVDRLAREGFRFTDAHSPSGTCTPTRYALLTGEYAWRRKGTGILPGNAALIITPGRPTLPSVLRSAGYRTGFVGKWHLGLADGHADWNGEIKPGPLEIGFDEAFYMPATGDRVPCVYVRNHRIVGLDPADPIQVSYKEKVGTEPTGKENPELLTRMTANNGHNNTIVNGIGRIGWMSGGKAARWNDETIGDELTREAAAFITRNKEQPFFLYLATHDIHVPRVPHPRYRGQTGMGPRGDALVSFDATIGALMKTLDEQGIASNTLFILTSDNGPVLDDGYNDEAVKKIGQHKPAGPFRGGKYSTFEGGTRLPFIVRWPARVKAGGTCDKLFGYIDTLGSLAALTGAKIPEGGAPDSLDELALLLGESDQPARPCLVEHDGGGLVALRAGNWECIPAGRDGAEKLFDLSTDPGESKNLASAMESKRASMAAMLKQARAAGDAGLRADDAPPRRKAEQGRKKAAP